MSLRSLAVLPLLALFACDGNGGGAGATTAAGNFPPPKVVTMDEGLPDPVARIGDQPITLQELEDEAAADVAKAQQDLYEARSNALENMIDDKLVTAEAAKRNVSKDDLLKAEVEDKSPKVTDADIQAFYDKNQARIRQPIDQVKDQIRARLEKQNQSQRMNEFLDELKKNAGVQVYLAPPRFKVDPKNAPRKGSAQAPVQIVEFSDFQCPYCKMANDTVHQLEDKYGDKVSIVYRNFPLPMHKNAHRAAEAGDCAADQGKFWEYADTMFNNQQALDDDSLVKYAGDVGMDADKFKTCLTGNTHVGDVDEDIKDGRKVGMSGTPGFYVNGRMISGARPIEAFSEVIDQELASNGQAPATTTAPPK